VSFGILLRQHRRAAGLTPEALAERAGLSANAIGALERGERRAPYRDTVRRLAEALGLNAEDRAAFEAAVERGRTAHVLPASPPGHEAGLVVGSAFTPLPPLIGRETELATLLRLLRRDDARLVTLTGPAGAGKTRLAVAVAAGLHELGEPAAEVDLAPLRDPSLVLAAVADCLAIQDGGRPPLERLIAALHDRRLLVVLDNFEQLLPAAADLPPLLAGAPGLKLLVTSRAALGLRVEQVFPVPLLALPDPRHLPALTDLARVPAVALFLQRATALGTDFVLAEHNAGAVAELCVRLDGLPLAIELAAARTPLFSPEMMLERLDERLSLLRWPASDLPERQQTLRAALSWSYELLTEQERALFRLLGVFAGGFTIEAVEALAPVVMPNGADVLGALSSLVAKSVAVSEQDAAEERRFRLLESIREYALEQLVEHGEEQAARQAHAAYFLALAEQATARLGGPLAELPPDEKRGQRAWLSSLERERDNIRAALERLASRPEREPELRLAIASCAACWIRGGFAEGRLRLEAALQRAADINPRLRMRALRVLGWLLIEQSEAGLARQIFTEALALGRSLGAERATGRLLGDLGLVAFHLGSPESAVPLLEEALAVAERTADAQGAGWVRSHLGVVTLSCGELGRAADLLAEAAAAFRAAGDLLMLPLALIPLAAALYGVGELGRAEDCLRESLDLSVELRDATALYGAVATIVSFAGEAMNAEAASCLLAAVQGLSWIQGARPTTDSFPQALATERNLRARLGRERYEAAQGEGRALSIEQIVTLAADVLSAAVAGGPKPETRPDPTDPLSPREREVLELVAEGLSNKEIAARLFVSERTARYHVTAVFNRLGVSTRAQAVAVASQRGML